MPDIVKTYLDYEHLTEYHNKLSQLIDDKIDDIPSTPITESIGSASSWNTGSITNATVNNNTLTITLGTLPSLTITPTTVVTDIT